MVSDLTTFGGQAIREEGCERMVDEAVAKEFVNGDRSGGDARGVRSCGRRAWSD